MKTVNELSCCPKCGNDEYYIKYSYSGRGILRLRFDGEEAENGDMYDCLKSKLISKYAFCDKCNYKIAKFENK